MKETIYYFVNIDGKFIRFYQLYLLSEYEDQFANIMSQFMKNKF